MVKRFQKWLRDWLAGHIIDVLTVGLEGLSLKLTTLAEGQRINTERHLDAIYQRVTALDGRIERAASAVLDMTAFLESEVGSMPTKLPGSWREYAAVDYGVTKILADKQFCEKVKDSEQFIEMIRWARRYCHEQDWPVPATERLESLVKARLNLYAPTELLLVRHLQSAG